MKMSFFKNLHFLSKCFLSKYYQLHTKHIYKKKVNVKNMKTLNKVCIFFSFRVMLIFECRGVFFVSFVPYTERAVCLW